METEHTEFVRWYYSKYGNQLENFISTFPHLEWNTFVATNYVSLDFIERNPYRHWNYTALSERKDLTWEFIKSSLIPYDWGALSQHPNISFQTIKMHSTCAWAKRRVLRNPNVTYKDVEDKFFKSIKSKANELSYNPSIPVETLLDSESTNWGALTRRAPVKVIWENLERPWVVPVLMERTDIDITALISLLKVLDKGCCYVTSLSKHPQITLSIVREFRDYSWDWSQLSRRVPFQEILENPNEPWDEERVSSRREVTFQVIKENPKIEFSLNIALLRGRIHPDDDHGCRQYYVSASPFVTMDMVLANPEKPWDYKGLSANPNMTLKIIKKNPQMPWSWEHLRSRVNLLSSQSNQEIFADLAIREREIRQNEVLSTLECMRLMIPDVNRVIAEFSDYI